MYIYTYIKQNLKTLRRASKNFEIFELSRLECILYYIMGTTSDSYTSTCQVTIFYGNTGAHLVFIAYYAGHYHGIAITFIM